MVNDNGFSGRQDDRTTGRQHEITDGQNLVDERGRRQEEGVLSQQHTAIHTTASLTVHTQLTISLLLLQILERGYSIWPYGWMDGLHYWLHWLRLSLESD
jgi:hypothetical protein